MVVLTWKQSSYRAVAGLVMLNDDQMLLSWQRQGKAGEFFEAVFSSFRITIRERISSPNSGCTFDDYC
jgi:hypothetical protein